jgi:hypothetical protein
MAKPTSDDLEAVRAITSALKDFTVDDQERILRWAREKLGLKSAAAMVAPAQHEVRTPPVAQQNTPPRSSDATEVQPPPGKDLKSFVKAKSPKSDVQYAATVAYFYRFEAPVGDRRDEIDAAILLNSCRLADWNRPPKPGQTLLNAKGQGLLDSGSGAGKFVINSVGENLVAMSLPSPSSSGSSKKPGKPKSRSARHKK